jgi:PAS domain S-box-containing protein
VLVAPVLIASVAFQLVAAGLAFRLVSVTGHRRGWTLVSLAILLMVARRATPLYRALAGDPTFTADLQFELVGLAISVCMAGGLASIGPLFRVLRCSEDRLRESQRRLEHLNAVLRGIRNVSQLIAREKDCGRLLQGVCQCLIEARGYRQAWIAMVDPGRGRMTLTEAGEIDALGPLREQLAGGKPPEWVLRAMEHPDVQWIPGAAPILATRLAGGNDVYGLLAAVLPDNTPVDEEERALFQETAGDVGFALQGMHVLRERQRAERSLRLDESRLEGLLQLNQMTEASLREITDFALEQAVRLTESKIGYLAFMDAEETTLTMHSWSKSAMEQCQILDKPLVYPVATTGLWGEAVRQRRPVITNDYAAPSPLKKGHPAGHVAITRHMNVPVFEGERIVVVAGVGNKEEPYGEADVRQLTLLMQGMWRLIQRHKAQEELRRARDELEIRVRQRTAELASANEKLSRERYLLLCLMNNLPHSIYFKDAQSRFLRINKALADYFGLRDPAEAVGRTDRDFFTREHAAQALADEQEILRTGQPMINKEEKETWPDGRVTWVSSTKLPLCDETGRPVGTFGISLDITEKKQADETLRTAKEAAESASRAKSTFLANMSHEIRTPLNGIIGMTELVLKSHLTDQQREFLTAARDSGESLLSVINEILDFSKIEAGKLRLERTVFDLWESLGDTIKSFGLKAHQQGLELACHLHPDVPRMLLGDYGRLRQIVVNLVGNAIKFTEQGEVVVEVWREPSAPDEALLHFLVRDTGIGIPADKQTTIFEMFEQADSSMSRRHGGTGLGLAIASRLAEMMGGRIWLESEVGRGSRFHFTVRLVPAPDQPPARPVPEPRSLVGLRVLVVDDNATNRRILEEMLTSWQMRVETAENAEQALDRLRAACQEHAPWQLLLTDAHMPDVDGFALVERIRRDPDLCSTVIMMLTSGDRPEDLSQCSQLDIAAYLMKPIKQSELFDAIVRLLGGVRPAPQPIVPAAEKPRVHGLRVLLAEDSLVNQKLAIALLEEQGHHVTLVRNGREAIAAVEAQTFDLVLMDVQMPEMDGLEATATIRARQNPAAPRLPILAMTAHALKGDRERCLEAGMDGYIAKPIHAEELYDAIDALRLTPAGPASDAAGG